MTNYPNPVPKGPGPKPPPAPPRPPRASDGFAELNPIDVNSPIDVNRPVGMHGVGSTVWKGFIAAMIRLHGRKLGDQSVKAIERHLSAAEAIYMVLLDAPPEKPKRGSR